MNKETIITLKDHMQETAQNVGLKVHLADEGKFIQIQLLDKHNRIIFTAYEVSNIIAFIQGLQSDYKYHISR